ncbi:hypothetical protein IG631_17548 [Alternaria alternata]|nr:hypothetical protein IG631_17548 [Alternaria alternata]
MQGGQGSMADTAEVQLRADHVFLSNPGYWGLLVCSWNQHTRVYPSKGRTKPSDVGSEDDAGASCPGSYTNSCTAFCCHLAMKQLPTPIQQGHQVLVAKDIPTSGSACLFVVAVNCKVNRRSFRDV